MFSGGREEMHRNKRVNLVYDIQKLYLDDSNVTLDEFPTDSEEVNTQILF